MSILRPDRALRASRVLVAGAALAATASLAPAAPVLASPTSPVTRASLMAGASQPPAHATVRPSGPAAAVTAEDPKRVGFGVVPATPRGIDQRAFFSYGLVPGATAFDHVALVNYSDRPLVLGIAPADALNTNEGGFAVQPTGEQPHDLGAWITIKGGNKAVTVPGRSRSGAPGRVILPVTISVPKNADPGDHGAAVVAILTTMSKNPQGQNVKLEQRVAARVYVTVAGDVKPGLMVSELHVDYRAPVLPWQSGDATVTYTVVNSGNVRMGFDPAIRVAGPFGLGSQTVDLDPVAELLPHNSQTFTQKVTGVWPTLWAGARVTATPQAAVAAAKPNLGQVTESRGFAALAWWLVILILVGLGLLGRMLSRRLRPSGTDRGTARASKRTRKQSDERELVGV
ncbi:hypothetical protein GCM10027053_17010 [Intrasporangium mesophilum]